MKPEDLREFAERSRGNVADAKRRHWQKVAQSGVGASAFEAGEALYEHARTLGSFPSERYLADDFAHQLRLKELIDRASQALAARRAAR